MANRNRCFYENRIEDEKWYGIEPCGKPGCSAAWERAEAIKKAEEKRRKRLDKSKK